MDPQTKEIMSYLLEKLIEDVVTKAQDEFPGCKPSSVVDEFIEKVSKHIKLNENEKEKMHHILDDFIEEVCARLKKARSGAINVSDLIDEYVENISVRLEFKPNDRSSFATLLQKLTRDLIGDLDAEASEKKSTSSTKAEEKKSTSSTEAAEKISVTSTTSSESGTCASECTARGYDPSSHRFTKAPLCREEECLEEEYEGGEEKDGKENKEKGGKKLVFTDSEYSQFLQDVIDKILSRVLDEIHSRQPPPPPYEKGSHPLQSRPKHEDERHPSIVIAKKPSPRAESECCIPSGQETCFNFRRWGITMLLFYLMLLPFTLFFGAIFGLAVCHRRPCTDNWPRFLGFRFAPPMDDSSMNMCTAF